ncbi:MAG: bifunctional [glutamate--ammonia ligase]-adenylyl-L-tyrosine phosphorylase/[glutamate--ammonia-ligase] adenylyltransferase [Fimbriiglobus sp.]|jgi:glutamate-ammonia-ligase adenylyltransferase|nr:bifunctional [glutamate--ammonia ligase]-adenylyl-L-tyrosine phosphorylase/[glutamate--ammonia-ligase] adenylyltransferase [Fimbriiglobus sp.]
MTPSLRDAARGQRNLDAIRKAAGEERFAELLVPLHRVLARSADPDLALNHLERVLGTSHGLAQLPNLLANKARALEGLLQLLAVSQFFADTFVTYPEAFDLLRAAPRRNPSTDELTAELKGLVDTCTDDAATLLVFRRFRHLHMLRIGANDILRDRSLEEVTRELARIADSSIKIALATAQKTVGKRFGTPMAGGVPARIAGFAFGKLGGDELNYSSDIDLMFVYDRDGETNKKSGAITNAEYYSRVVTEVVRLLSSVTDRGFAYRVDLRLRPEGKAGPLARSLDSTLSYYDLRGRTWERQALIKLRPVAGDRELRKEVMTAIEPFVYRKYFSFSEINEVKALKRKMEQNATRSGIDDTDVKTGRGGIRDVEYTVQFLQLLNGGDLPAVRQRNTLLALDALEIAGCLTPQETYLLSDAYRFLRRTEHRLQLLFDWQTHKLPTGVDELRTLARRMGYEFRGQNSPDRGHEAASSELTPDLRHRTAQKRSPLDESPEPTLDTRQLLVDPLDLFLKDFHDKTALNRKILDHLLHQTFANDAGGSEPESDLVLDPDPDDATVREVLSKYPFRDVKAAYHNLNRLAQEAVPFLSHRRCRHFLASIAAPLLKAVAETPDPDGTLNDLERVTASLGAKAVLYELFSFNPPSLKLYVDICASSPYLSGILTNNPGMIDELLDSLVLDQPRTRAELSAELAALLRGASDVDPILHSFQDKELLRIGVQDLLGKADIRTTTAELSDLAESLLNAVFDMTEPVVRGKLSDPGGEYAVLGLGKLGGREISYHSDLDIVLVYANGDTDRQHFYTTLGQQAIKLASRPGPLGKLYEVDMRLRPTGKSGSLALSLDEFRRYFGGTAQVWERLALTRARVVRGSGRLTDELAASVQEAVTGKLNGPVPTAEVTAMRAKLEGAANPRSLKRGRGGLTDVEFAVQLLQLRHGRTHPEVLRANVWDAIDALAASGLLAMTAAADLRDGYSFLRFVEARLRIVTDRPLTEVPESLDDLAKLARRSGFTSADAFLAELAAKRAAVRTAYEEIVR